MALGKINLDESHDERKDIVLYRCPQCGRFVPLIKIPNMFGAWFFGLFYFIYYCLIRKEECVICGYRFKGSDFANIEKMNLDIRGIARARANYTRDSMTPLTS